MSRGFDTVGSLLADIATLISESIQTLRIADKSHWEQEEHELLRALETALDEAKKDFQDMGPLVNGQSNYERDRKHESIEELRALRRKFRTQADNLRDWSRLGGQINPTWIRDTHRLQRDLHRAQCRAARRIFSSGQEAHSPRCLGAFLVHRKQRAWAHSGMGGFHHHSGSVGGGGDLFQRRYLEELMACKSVGGFERLGSHDIAFVCDFCDGHMVWKDLDSVPTTRAPQDTAFAAPSFTNSPPSASSSLSPSSSPSSPPVARGGRIAASAGLIGGGGVGGGRTPYWQAAGVTRSTLQDKQVVFAPVVIANHMAPPLGEWQARLICPFCEAEGDRPLDEDDEEDVWKPDFEFEDVEELREHLEWEHGPLGVGVGGVGGVGVSVGVGVGGVSGASQTGMAQQSSGCQIM